MDYACLMDINLGKDLGLIQSLKTEPIEMDERKGDPNMDVSGKIKIMNERRTRHPESGSTVLVT
ncbi:hypothetical protein ACLOJK_007008 [Asimina triloba]